MKRRRNTSIAIHCHIKKTRRNFYDHELREKLASGFNELQKFPLMCGAPCVGFRVKWCDNDAIITMCWMRFVSQMSRRRCIMWTSLTLFLSLRFSLSMEDRFRRFLMVQFESHDSVIDAELFNEFVVVTLRSFRELSGPSGLSVLAFSPRGLSPPKAKQESIRGLRKSFTSGSHARGAF